MGGRRSWVRGMKRNGLSQAPMMRPWVTTSYRQAQMRVRRSLRRRDRGFTSTNRPRLAISVPPKHDNT